MKEICVTQVGIFHVLGRQTDLQIDILYFCQLVDKDSSEKIVQNHVLTHVTDVILLMVYVNMVVSLAGWDTSAMNKMVMSFSTLSRYVKSYKCFIRY